jgi:uncharacterized protein YndB with AHSA1/START domain
MQKQKLGAKGGGDGTTLELISDREIKITRAFEAPAQVVFTALTTPELVKRWWAPKSRGEMLHCSIDLKVGGAWRYVMRANHGFEVGFSGKFLEIEAPNKIVQTEIFDPFPDTAAIVTVTLVESQGCTLMTSSSLYPSSAVRDQVIASGMEGGMRESYLQLTDVVRAAALPPA